MWTIPPKIEVKTQSYVTTANVTLAGEEACSAETQSPAMFWATIHIRQEQEVLSVFRGSHEPTWVDEIQAFSPQPCSCQEPAV